MKPRLCRFSWRAFVSTHPPMLSLTLFMEVLFAWPPSPPWKTCLPSLWNPPFPPHAPALIPLFLAKVQLFVTLTLSHLTIWRSGQIALFFLAKAALVYLPTAHFVALKPFFSAGPSLLQVCHFSSFLLLSDSRSVLATLSSSRSFLLL